MPLKLQELAFLSRLKELDPHAFQIEHLLDNISFLAHNTLVNKLPTETRARILAMLCEGSSMRSIARVCDVSTNTVNKLLVDAGIACAIFHSETVRGLKVKRVQCDEIWSFCNKKQSNATALDSQMGRGDVWTWTAIDADSKLIISWTVGDRDATAAFIFMNDVRDRLATRVQLTTDGWKAYLDAVEEAFGGDVDYAMLVKIYGDDKSVARGSPERRYSPSQVVGTQYQRICGAPNAHYTSTSFVERHNLTMRMPMRRFTRLTNAFSNKIDNHCHALALYFVWYNFVKIHKAHRATPAMAADISNRLWDMGDLVALIDAAASAPVKRGPYKKRA